VAHGRTNRVLATLLLGRDLSRMDEVRQRGISVDIHYVLFVTEKYGKAGFILDEMGISH
jgi:selenocysteine-specific translation elongation factor